MSLPFRGGSLRIVPATQPFLLLCASRDSFVLTTLVSFFPFDFYNSSRLVLCPASSRSAARDSAALEREIAMLSERYGEAAAEARTTGKALREKEALLDAVTAQVVAAESR